MRLRWKRAAGLMAAAGVLSTLGASTASAQSSTTTATLYTSTVGVPKWVRAGTSFYAHMWYMQNSKYRIGASDFDADLWSFAAPTHRGVTITWLNPLTHRWQTSTSDYAEGSVLALGSPQGVVMVPNHWYRLDFKVTISQGVHSGLWHMGAGIAATSYRGFAPPPLFNLVSNDPTARVYH